MKEALDFATNRCFEKNPNNSSKNKKGLHILVFILFFTLFCAFFDFHNFAFCFVFIANLIFLTNFIFKFILFFIYLNSKKLPPKLPTEIEKEKDVPIYTILLPCLKEEKGVLIELVSAISNLKYPKEKVDVKFLVEEDDEATITNLSQINHDFDLVKIPNSFPKTKPKACNLGLFLAKGEFIVIYDAEDRPNETQLLEALSYFQQDKELFVIQFLLNFYNHNTNRLSQFFSLEYLVWFNAFLPSIAKLKTIIPLGGTSNHFNVKKLIEIGGWDAFNVTEDAELGVRIAKYKLKTKIATNYTLEEAPYDIKTWLFQRQRWIKGHLQTFLAHLFTGKFFEILITIGFSFFSFFLIPFSFIFSLFINSKIINILFLINIIFSISYIFIFYIVAKKEKFANYNGAEKWILFYFILHIIASFMAFWQFLFKPFYWNKTRHGNRIQNDKILSSVK
jgi:cellulose synthase/poly-beta-1,6-N-acetylglucosamine synthase-like glycosyltransferase